MNKTANIFGNGRFARQLVFEKLGQGISRAILVSTFSELHALCSCLTTISIEYRHRIKISNRRATQRCNVCPRFFMQKYAVYWPEGGAASQYSVFIGQKMSLTG